MIKDNEDGISLFICAHPEQSTEFDGDLNDESLETVEVEIPDEYFTMINV